MADLKTGDPEVAEEEAQRGDYYEARQTRSGKNMTEAIKVWTSSVSSPFPVTRPFRLSKSQVGLGRD